ncbi:ISL3 family transposase [Lactobacillus helveticus]|uniref:ISL3 family transposase n=1 Tax=Lactobacillus helveticus TaxID=1587 RepID=UPI001C56D2B4|nr:ISL3 family transposase [Lactobacillus helveticus]MBW1219771.1 ISL3 family transposase [Lactobacillus helveticus]
MSSFNNCIKFDLDIKEKNIVFKDYFYKMVQMKKHKIYEAELIQPACPYCGSLALLHNGHLLTNIRYLTANSSHPATIRLAKQRVRCRDCSRWSMAQSELASKYCSISNASKLKILSALTEDRSMTSIASENNVSVNTVQRVLGSCSHRFLDSYEYLPAHLAFDEFKGVDRQLHFICLDGDSHQVVQILRTRYKKNLLKYFGRFSPQARANVRTVTMDLNFYYQDIVRACFPNAQIVIDRFHMIQMLTRSFNSLRVKVMKTFDKRSRQYQLLKSPWKLYLKKFDELEKVHPRYNWHYKDCLTQAQVVTEGINANTALENSYNLMQDFIQAIETGNTQKLKSLINCKDQIGTLMHKTLLTFKYNLTAVLNGAELPYSNGCLEGFNRKIKQIERTAFGYSSFTNLLTRIRLEENLYKEKEPNSLLMVA